MSDQVESITHHVISDITGQTGLAIIDASLNGERSPFALAKLRHDRIKASEEVIAKSLVGDYRTEDLFTLRRSVAAYRNYQQLIGIATARFAVPWMIPAPGDANRFQHPQSCA
jgi:hypothetical protein